MRPRSITILGGGTAGWMAACLFQHHWPGTAITLIESSAIGIIGVGEGSTPQLKHFFDTIGITEAEWMPRCNATYKAGIEFAGWSERAGHERYFHPFPTAIDRHTAPQFFYNTRARRTGRDVLGHPDRFFLTSALAAQRKAPIAPPNFPFQTGYGYHFDAVLVGEYLREVATARGVVHVDAKIVEVVLLPDGNIAELRAEDGRRVASELFVDASGFRALIIEGALGEPHVSFAENLFNDRAVVTPTGVAEGGPTVATRATALSAGWAWDIPLTNRTGNGYVYSSRYLEPEAAAAELLDHLGLPRETEVRHLQMRVGRIARSWVCNCLAIGLAQGFIEPLEATALHIVLATVEGFIETVDGDGEAGRGGFNDRTARRYEGIRDYIVAHYRLQLRRDTPYWRDAAALDCLSESLKGVMTAWFTGNDLEEEIASQDIAGYYPALSWHCLLAGYGNFPDAAKLRPPGQDVERHDMAAIDAFIAGCASNYPSHREALARLTTA